MNWTTVQTAIQQWASAGAGGIPVYWAQQKAPRPAGSFVSLRVMSMTQVGQDWFNVQNATSPSSGAEIELKGRGTRSMTVSIQAFAGPTADGLGSDSPLAVLENIRSYAVLDTSQLILNNAEIGLLSLNPVLSIDGVLGSHSFEPRAIMDVTFTVPSEVSEFATYIEKVEIENETAGTPPFEVP